MAKKRQSGTNPSSVEQDLGATSQALSDSDEGFGSQSSEGSTFTLRINEPHPRHPATPQASMFHLPLTPAGESAVSTNAGTGSSDPQVKQTVKRSRKRKKRSSAGESPVPASTDGPEDDHERHWRMAGAVYENEVAGLMAGERTKLSLLARAYLQHMQESTSHKSARSRSTPQDDRAAGLSKKRQRTMVCEHPTFRRRMGHSTEQCFTRKRELEAQVDRSKAPAADPADEDPESNASGTKPRKLGRSTVE